MRRWIFTLIAFLFMIFAGGETPAARVKGLVNGHETTGVHRVRWDGTNDRGARVSSGIYFYRLIAGSFKSTRKMVLLR